VGFLCRRQSLPADGAFHAGRILPVRPGARVGRKAACRRRIRGMAGGSL
jgi:hypothetical protein